MAVAKLKLKTERLFTVAEYLNMERDALERNEYVDGKLFQMAGESDDHGDITVNLVGVLRAGLKNTECRARTMNAKIKTGGFAENIATSTRGMFSYPDVVVVCGKVEYHDRKKDVILNPKVIIEVLSKSTERFDRNDKFVRYRMFNETLSDYILVSQDKPMIEHFIRQHDQGWKVLTYIGLDMTCPIDSISCDLPLAEVYDRVRFSRKALKFLKEIARIK